MRKLKETFNSRKMKKMNPRQLVLCLLAGAMLSQPVSAEEASSAESASIEALLEHLADERDDVTRFDPVVEAVAGEPERAAELAAALCREYPALAGAIVRSIVAGLPDGDNVSDIVRAAVKAAPESMQDIVAAATAEAPGQEDVVSAAAGEALRELADDELRVEEDEETDAPAVLGDDEYAEIEDEELETISVDFPDTNIRTILRSVADLYELNLVIPEELTGQASVQLRDVTWRQVFDIVLSPIGYTYVEEEGIIQVVRDDFVDLGVPDEQVTMHDDGTMTVNFDNVPIADIVTRVSSAADINVVIPQDFMTMGAEATATIRLRNVGWQQVFDVSLSQVGYGYIDRDDIIRIETLDRIQAVPPATRVIQVKFPPASAIAELVSNLSGVQQVQVDSGTNVLIVTAEEGKMREVQSLVDRLDQPAQQVLIEAMFIEVSGTDARDLGVKWQSLADGMEVSAGPATHRWERMRGQADPGFSDLMESVGTARHSEAIFNASEFNAILTALQRETDARLTASPTVVTMNAEEAEIQVIDHLYRDGAINVFGTGQPGDPVRESFEEPILLEPLPGIMLAVTPTISGGDLINLRARPEINNVVGTQTLGQGQVIPTIRQRTVTSNVMVKSGQTLAMSGLADEDSVTVESKVPLLGDIPVVGRLFRSDSRDSLRKDQIIFITATITDPDRHNYTDFIDERRMMEMDLSHREIQGSQYQRTAEEEQYLEELSRWRSEQQREQIRQMMEDLEQDDPEGTRESRGARTGPRQRR